MFDIGMSETKCLQVSLNFEANWSRGSCIMIEHTNTQTDTDKQRLNFIEDTLHSTQSIYYLHLYTVYYYYYT